jgi:hypothetical protein
MEGNNDNSYSCFSASDYTAVFHKSFTVQSLARAFLAD